MELPVQGPLGGLVIGSDASLYRSAPGVLAAAARLAVADGVVLTTVDKAVAGGMYTAASLRRDDDTLGDGGGLSGLAVAPSDLGERQARPDLALDVQPVQRRHPDREHKHAGGRGLQEQSADQWTARRRGRRLGLDLLELRAPTAAQPIDSGTGHLRACSACTCRRRPTPWAPDGPSRLLGGQGQAPGGRGDDHAADRNRHPGLQGPRVLNYSLRSFGEAVQMRHSGGVSLGAQANPDTLLHLHGNASSHGSLTIESESSNPPAPNAETRRACTSRTGSW